MKKLLKVLESCTKKELIQLIGIMSKSTSSYVLKHAISHVVFERKQALLSQAAELGGIAAAELQKYADLLRPYDGKPLTTVPTDIIDEAAEHFKAYKTAEKKEKALYKKADELEEKGLNYDYETE